MQTIKELLGNENEKPLDRMVTDGGFCGILRTVACIGDSLSSGEFEGRKDGKPTYHDYFDYSWGQFFARMSGNTVLNFSRGGMTAKEYCEGFAHSKGLWDKDKACRAYIIALGVNDMNMFPDEMGDETDVDLENWRNNKHTFTGYYAQIIQRYKEIQPDAKFFLMTTLRTPADNESQAKRRERHRELLFRLADIFDNCYVLDFYTYGYPDDCEFRKAFYMGGHLTPCGYLLTARMVASYVDYLIRHNLEDFDEVGFMGSPYSYKVPWN